MARHVLVVDDDPDVRDALKDALEGEGYAVTTAANGAEALEHLACGDLPAVVLLDLMMPVLDGWGVLQEVQKRPALATLKIVILSAGGAKARSSLPPKTPFVDKPVGYDRLLELVAGCCRD